MKQRAADLPPVYFALVMATGIVSVDAGRLGLDVLSSVMFGIGALAYAVLVALTAVRVVRYGDRVRRDLRDPGTAFSFFTFVAASDVLAARIPAAHAVGLIAALGAVALVAFVLLAPRVARTPLRLPRRDLSRLARGNWLVAVVALQSLVIVGTTVAQRWRVEPLLGVALAGWFAGLAVYALLIGFVGARLRSAFDDPDVFRPDFWITMGALAISIVAGAQLLEADNHLGVLSGLRAPVHALLWIAWAAASAWIPVMLAIELQSWRRKPHALRYVPHRWAMVFPLGMYASATLAMHDELAVPPFDVLGKLFFWSALAAWSLTALGLVRTLRGR